MNDDLECDGFEELLARACASGTDEERAGGRSAAIRAFNRIEAGRRARRDRWRSRSRARWALLGLGWLAAAAWVIRAILSFSAGEASSPIPQGATTALDTLSMLISVTPFQLIAGFALLAAATAAGVRLALIDD
jgi:hypothetical protein